MKRLIYLSIVALGATASPAFAQTPILQAGDPILAIDLIPDSRSSHPAGEAPKFAIDGLSNTKYLNFAKIDTGILVTPAAGSTTVTGIQLTTAGDAAERDPASWALYGTNDAIDHVAENNGDGTAFSWTLISQNLISLPAERSALGPLVSFANATPYSSYRVIFPTIKNEATANSMQVAEIALLNAANVNVLSSSDLVSATQLPQPANSSYPPGEAPQFILDGAATNAPPPAVGPLTKYLNFGKKGAGFIVTPSVGATVLGSFEITTANDAPGRDPSSWELYGANDMITSADNSSVNPENWVLIGADAITLPTERDTTGARVFISNSESYMSYRMVFPTLRDGNNVNSMQVAGVQFYAVPEPTTLAMGTLGLVAAGCLRKR